MSQTSFLTLVRRSGNFRTDGEASRAANAVFGTIKLWLTPAASDRVRQALPKDASRIWQFSPAPFGAGHLPKKDGEQPVADLHFILRIQQLGGYQSHKEARSAACSVLKALARSVPEELARYVGQSFPSAMPLVCPAFIQGKAA